MMDEKVQEHANIREA